MKENRKRQEGRTHSGLCRLLGSLVVLFAWLMPQGAWAADSDLDQVTVGDKSFYVLRNTDDWNKFRALVTAAGGGSDVNAIMDGDILTTDICGDASHPYNGIFDGNGHYLQLGIARNADCTAPFGAVRNATIKNLHVTGATRGSNHNSGLIGQVEDGSNRNVTIERVWVSTTVTSTSRLVGGFIGHAHDGNLTISDCLFDGILNANGHSLSYGGAIVGWAHTEGKWEMNRVYENGTYNNISHPGFSSWNMGNSWWASGTLCLSAHDWGEMASGCTNITKQNDVVSKMNKGQGGTWQLKDGKAVPVMEETKIEASFETYDMIPGTEEGEEGMVKIPFSCDQAVKWIDVTYTNENGEKKTLDRINYSKNTYAGFILLPATEQHKNLTLTVKLLLGSTTVTIDGKKDAMMHNPLDLTAQLLRFSTNKVLADAGAVELKWQVKNPGYADVMSSDNFMVMRSLTGKDEDMEAVGSVAFDEKTTSYTYKDETLTSALEAKHINELTVTPNVRYIVVRESAQGLWGLAGNAASAAVGCQLPMLHLLRIKDWQTAWQDETARTVKVTWEYADEAGAVWDDRAQMNIVVTAINRAGSAVSTKTITLTADEIAACQKVIELDRSCVDYGIIFDVEQGTSPIPVEAPYFEIRTAADWTEFVARVKAAKGGSNVNASLMADLTVSEIAAYSGNEPYRGTFEGNGHTLNLNISDNAMNTALFSHVATATFRNLNLTGTVSCTTKHLGSLIGCTEKNSTVTIENCRSSVNLVSSVNDDSDVGGFIGLVGEGSTQTTFFNCVFDGSFEGPNNQRNGGFVAWVSGGGPITIQNCLFAPTAINTGFRDCQTWVRSYKTTVTITNSYATKEYKESADVPEHYMVIRDATNWETFRSLVSTAQTGVNAILMADITVNEGMVGTQSNPYRGVFDGNGHTLTVNYSNVNAPFGYTAGATFKNLNVAGSISSSSKNVAGLVRFCLSGTNTITNCRMSATLDCSINGDATNGGFVAYTAGDATLNITDCVFDGKFTGSKCYANGGFVGFNDGYTNLKNCLFNGTFSTLTSGNRTFARSRDNNKITLTNVYYITDMDDGNPKQGTSASGIDQQTLVSKLGTNWYVKNGKAAPILQVNLVNGTVAGKTAAQIVALLGSGWTTVSGDPVPKMANNQQVEIANSAKFPFKIHSADDWNTFRRMVDEAKGTKDIYAQLMADISITEPVGVSTGHFRGGFNGNGHTLTVNINKGGWNSAAPFQFVTGNSTIYNLHVTGNVTGQKYAAGIVGEVDNGATVKVLNCHSSVYLNVLRYGGGIVGNFNSATLTVSNCLFDGTIHNRSYVLWNGGSASFAGAFVGWGENSNLVVENCLDNGTFEGFNYGSRYLYSANCNGAWTAWGGTNNWTNDDIVARVCNKIGTMSTTALVGALGSMWKVDVTGKALPCTIGSLIDGMPTFYYENLGHIDQNSLQVRTLATSAVLTWANVDDEPVDYYEVWRKDKEESEFKLLVTQLIDTQYEDKTTSPVHQYIYKVRGVTSCEGLHYDETKEVDGMCEQTGTVEGYLRFLDGTGIPGEKIVVTVDGKERSAMTDESGFFRFTGLPYKNKAETNYSLTVVGVTGIDPVAVTLGTEPGENVVKSVVIEVGSSVKIAGYVQYDGTSIPVQGASFLVNGHEVRTAAGKVETDHEGKFSFRILPGDATIQAVKDGHTFLRDGYYHENDDDPDTTITYNFNTDKAGLIFYDQTRVKLIGRIVGGKTQGEKPLGHGLSTNNLGDSLRMVFTLEGDNASRLVFDIQDRNLKERDEVFEHTTANSHDKKYTYQTSTHTTLNRMVVTPDAHTGEYEVWLPPVKWKIQQITASGYATLFQDGQTNDVIDLTDSLTLHKDVVKGTWKTIGYGNEVKDPVEEYHAKYCRIYHSPVIIDYRQQGFEGFDYFGDQYYSYQNVSGTKEKLPLAYGVRKQDWPVGKRDSLETHYTFGYPVFNIDRKYPIDIAATERYYYNNNTKSDTIDVVHLSGGVVTIHNGMVSATHCDTLQLDEKGQGTYMMEAAQTPYLLTGDDALSTVSITLELDGTHYEATPLKAYVLNIKPTDGAKDILNYSAPLLVDILRDPPGSSSKATLSKGSTLKYSYTMDLKWSAGAAINVGIGTGVDTFTGVVMAPMGAGAVAGFKNGGTNYFGTTIDLVWSGSGQRAFNYTMTADEDISTSTDPTMVGANGDLYIGVVQNIVVSPATAIRAIPDNVFQQMGGALKAGRMVEIAQGKDNNGKTLHLVRDEVVTCAPEITSDFVHSQHYIVNQLLPELAEQIYSMMFIGTEAQAKAKANADQKPVYLSLVGKDHADFGTRYKMISPDGAPDNTVDEVKKYQEAMHKWAEMIAQNEKEKLTATDLVKNFDVDGGSSVSYSETFTSDYSVMNSFVSPITSGTTGYFEDAGDGAAGFAAIVGPMVAKLLADVLAGGAGKTTSEYDISADDKGLNLDVETTGFTFKFSLVPAMTFSITPEDTESKSYSRTESFTIDMNKKNHLDFDVYRVKTSVDAVSNGSMGDLDVFYNKNFYDLVDYNRNRMKDDVDVSKFRYSRSFVYRTRGGATCRPWEGERATLFYEPGKVIDERTKKIENPQIKMDKQSVSGVPYGEPARFKLYLTNESEQPEAVYYYFDLYQVDMSNPKGAKLMIDGMPLTGTERTVEIHPGVVTEKTLEVYAGEDFDYEGLTIGLISQDDVKTYAEVSFDVHFLQTAGGIAISSPGDKWIMNCDAPTDGSKGWYLPVVISGFDKNQHNFDHIEFQYKETTRGDDYWTNLCGYYADSTLYRAASGTKAMIPENGNITARFFGEGTVMEKAYDLRAVLFCRNGNAFLTNESMVLSGVKDTRRPQLFGTPEPKTGVLGVGDNIIFNFSEDIEYNYLQATTNFEVVGETNETAVQEAPSLLFGGNGYAQTEARRNFSDKSVTIEVMIKPDEVEKNMPIFSHGSDGKHLQLWLTQDKHLKAMVDNVELLSNTTLTGTGFQRVALVLDNEAKQLMLYANEQIGRKDNVTYSGYGPLTFGATSEDASGKRTYYQGRMLQARVWNRALDLASLNRYGNKQLTGYELGLVDYYPMNEGRGDYATDLAQGAHLTLNGASWALPEGMSLKLEGNTGTETADKNIAISSEKDWNTFCSMVAAAKGKYNVNASLLADITITEPVGVSTGYFRGTFDGNGHTLTANLNKNEVGMAPIHYVTGTTTIRNLNVDGTIKGSNMSCGIAGVMDNSANLLVENCHVSAHIITTNNWAGGIIGHAHNSRTTVRNCLFDGTLTNNASGTSYAGAFFCWGDGGTFVTEHCLEKGTYENFMHVGANYRSTNNRNAFGGKTNYTYQDWGEISKVGTMTSAELAAALGTQWMVNSADQVVPIVSITNTMAGTQKGLQLRSDLFQRDDEQDYTLMFWFKTAKSDGTLMANGAGKANDEGAKNKFFIGFENDTLRYRTNGNEYALGDNLCDDAWHHYAMSVNRMRNVASIYIDNVPKVQFTTDSLGGMLGTRFFLGNTVWQIAGNPVVFEENALTGHIDGLALFEQALPLTLIKRYTNKAPGGSEKGLIAYVDFDHQERQKNGELTLQPYVLNKKVKYDNDGNATGKADSVFVNPVADVLAQVDINVGAPMQAYEELRNLNFSYVGRDNQILVNIDEQDSRVNKQNVYVTLYDIPDKNGNFMKWPATECFFVDRNPLAWGEKRITTTMMAGYDRELFLQIVNKGGKAHTYTIENLPRWMTADKLSNVVDAQSTDNVNITISKDINVGTYDQIIYLTDEDGLSEPLPIELTVEGEEPYWEVDQNLKRYSMNIVAQVFVGNTLVTDAHDKVAAFDAAGRCMGVNNIKYDANTGRSMLYMTIYDSTTVASTLTFQLWHYATGATMMLRTEPEAISFAEQTTVGTVSHPVQMYATERYKQTIDLAEGWNWISFYVYNQALEDLTTILSRYPWQEGDILTEDSRDLTLVYRNGLWMSNTEVDIDNIDMSQEYSYRIKVQEDQHVEIWGEAFKDPEDRTIHLKQGWNSIGYTPLVNLPVGTALTEYFDEATDGDVIKNQHEFAMFESDGKGGGEWLGTLEYMKPGEGYMLHRQSATPTSFRYPYYEPGTTFIGTSGAPRRIGSPYAATMNIVAQAVGVEVQPGDRLAAYASGELVGEAVVSDQTADYGELFFLNIEGDVEAPLSFTIERDGEIIATTRQTITYKVHAISGSPAEPTSINFVSYDPANDGLWYSVSGIKLGKRPATPGVYIFNGRKVVIK